VQPTILKKLHFPLVAYNWHLYNFEVSSYWHEATKPSTKP